MMLRGLETRLRKLEAARKPSDARFFMLWSRDEAEGETALAKAVAIGTVGPGDTVIRERWPKAESFPASRWVSDNGLSRDEDNVLHVRVRARARELGVDLDRPIDWSKERDHVAAAMSDEQLYAGLFGRRLQLPQ